MIKRYDLFSEEAPKMPQKLPSVVAHVCSKAPKHMRPAVAKMWFFPAKAQMRGASFRYVDNTVREAAPGGGGVCVGNSGIGKKTIDIMVEKIARYQRAHDEESYAKLAEWIQECKSRGKNKGQPARPCCPLLFPDLDMTPAAFLANLLDLQKEGNSTQFTHTNETERMDKMCGSHREATVIMRKAADVDYHGSLRFTAEGASGNPRIRWTYTASTTPTRAREYFLKSLEDGTLARIDFSYILPPTERHGIPRQGNYNEAWLTKLDEYLTRLRAATGEIKVPRIDAIVKELDKELGEIADLGDDEIFSSWYHRSIEQAWLLGCVCFVAEGYRFSKEIENLVVWSCYYDLWSKLQVFGVLLKHKKEKFVEVDVKKAGPVNMLDMLPDTFSREQLEELRRSMNKKAYGNHQLCMWLNLGYITCDEATRLYTKTEEYLSRL